MKNVRDRTRAARIWSTGKIAFLLGALSTLAAPQPATAVPPSTPPPTESTAIALVGEAPRVPPPDTPPAAAATAGKSAKNSAVIQSSTDPIQASNSERQGLAEIALASQFIDKGERAGNESAQRAAYSGARKHAERAIGLLPENADAHFLLFAAKGRVAQLDGLTSAAIQLVALNRELDYVLHLDPNHADALASRGGMLVKLPFLLGGDTKKGIEFLERAVRLDNKAVGKRLELAEAYHIIGRDEDARASVANAEALAQAMKDPARSKSVAAFRQALESACQGCSVEIIGR